LPDRGIGAGSGSKYRCLGEVGLFPHIPMNWKGPDSRCLPGLEKTAEQFPTLFGFVFHCAVRHFRGWLTRCQPYLSRQVKVRPS
jgi:hypothetical protein